MFVGCNRRIFLRCFFEHISISSVRWLGVAASHSFVFIRRSLIWCAATSSRFSAAASLLVSSSAKLPGQRTRLLSLIQSGSSSSSTSHSMQSDKDDSLWSVSAVEAGQRTWCKFLFGRAPSSFSCPESWLRKQQQQPSGDGILPENKIPRIPRKSSGYYKPEVIVSARVVGLGNYWKEWTDNKGINTDRSSTEHRSGDPCNWCDQNIATHVLWSSDMNAAETAIHQRRC